MNEQPAIRIRVLRDPIAADLPLPCLMTEGAAAADLRAALEAPFTLDPGKRALINTGLRIEIPRVYEGQVRPRSGLAIKNGITLLNSPGTIDSDYRGEVAVIMLNTTKEHRRVRHGDRIAQCLIGEPKLIIVDEPDALLVCHRDRAQGVKAVVDRLQAEGRSDLL